MIALVLLDTTALAANRTICVRVQPNYGDATYGTNRYDMDDYLNSNSTKYVLNGAKITVSGTNYLSSQYASESTGCVTFTGVTANANYTVELATVAQVNGQLVVIADAAVAGTAYLKLVPWTAPNTSTISYLDVVVGQDIEWNMILATAWAVYNNDLGLPDQTLTMVFDGVCGGFDKQNDVACTTSNNKAVEVHEFAHLLLWRKLGGTPADNVNNSVCDKDLLTDDCPCRNPTPGVPEASHDLQQKRFLAEAVYEGFAHYYAAVAFNNVNEADCFYQYYKNSDFDRDSDNEPLTVNCGQARPWEDASGVPLDSSDSYYNQAIGEDDYLWDSSHDLACDSVAVANHGTELDVMRFWWDLQQQGMGVDVVADILSLSSMFKCPVPTPAWACWDEDASWFDSIHNPAVLMQSAALTWDATHSGVDYAPLWQELSRVHGVAW